jgi:hypothetical protein
MSFVDDEGYYWDAESEAEFAQGKRHRRIKMQVKVDNVSKKRNSIVSNETWYNFEKNSTQTFDESVKRGTTLELEMDNGVIKGYKVVGNSEAPKKSFALRQAGPVDPNKDAKICLGNAFNAVFAPVYTNLAGKEGQSHEEAFTSTIEAVKYVAKILSEAK